ncbi:MAG: ATP-binding protein [Candidatus Binatia bacterium]
MIPRFKTIRHSLPIKVTILIVVILIAGFGGLLIVNIRREADSLIEKYEETARLLAASITTSIRNGMLESRPDIIIRLINELKEKLTEVRRIDLYRRNGVPAFTDLETVNEVDRFTGLEPEFIERISKMRAEPGPRIEHPLFTLAVEKQVPYESYESLDGGRVLTLFEPLKNSTDCQECHGKNHKVRGVLRISLGLEKLDAELREARNRQFGIALFTILGVTAGVIMFMGRVVLRPIGKVVQVAQKIGSGDLNARVDLTSEDEIGQLSSAINEMAGHLKKAYGELESEIVERTRAEQELTRSLDRLKLQALELEKANSVKSEFLGVMSHELRTPLNVILGYTWLLSQRGLGEISAKQEQTLVKLERQSRMLLTMVNSILEASKIEAEASTAETYEVRLSRLFEDLQSTSAILVDKDVALHWDYPADLPVIKTDGGKLRQILQNIINNALKFTDKGAVTVSARVDTEAKILEVSVEDTGIGISEESLPTVFEMFRQIDSSDTRRYGGVGLGLYIVKKFTDLLGGTVEVKSAQGQGSVFTVRIPYQN